MFLVTLSGDRHERREELRGGAIRVLSRFGVRTTERLLIEALPKTAPERILSGLDSEAAVALVSAGIYPHAECTYAILDAYVGRKVAANVQKVGAAERVRVHVGADLPGFVGRGARGEAPFDLVALPCPKRGESLLQREMIEEAHDVLAMGGLFLAAVDGDPRKLKDMVKRAFGKAEVNAGEGGAVVRATRTREALAWKDHAHVLSVSAPARPLEIESRPGTFSYGRLDRGTKALMETLPERLPPKAKILDLGSGHGVLGLAAVAASRDGRAMLVDSNARAIDLAARNAERNGLRGAEALLRADFEQLPTETFDMALANPPYFGDFRIAEAFVRTARRSLRRGGELRLVAMAADEHAVIVRRHFKDAEVVHAGEYGIVTARA